MHYQNLATIGIVALVLAAGGCHRDVGESRDTAREERTPAVDRAAELNESATKKSHGSTSAWLTSNETTRRRIRRL